MFDARIIQLEHIHEGERVPMARREHHSPDDDDLERALAQGAQLWRCERCADEVLVVPDQSSGPAERGL